MQKIAPFLWFNNNAEEAVNFYVSTIPNSKMIRTMPGAEGTPMGLIFELQGLELMAINGGPQFTFTPAISLFVNCDTQDEVDELWEKMSAGGEKQQCGWLKDKFGVSWQIVPTVLGKMLADPDPVKANRVMRKMLTMNKLDINGLEEAYHG
jgi:predicted 3-demethylubiquinone-9 3-methyltransferase (glyoxalase superfamily)